MARQSGSNTDKREILKYKGKNCVIIVSSKYIEYLCYFVCTPHMETNPTVIHSNADKDSVVVRVFSQSKNFTTLTTKYEYPPMLLFLIIT